MISDLVLQLISLLKTSLSFTFEPTEKKTETIFCEGVIDRISENCVPFCRKFQCLVLFLNYNLCTLSQRLCLNLSFNGTITIPTQISNNQNTIFHYALSNGSKSTQIFCQNAQTIATERLLRSDRQKKIEKWQLIPAT